VKEDRPDHSLAPIESAYHLGQKLTGIVLTLGMRVSKICRSRNVIKLVFVSIVCSVSLLISRTVGYNSSGKQHRSSFGYCP